MKKIAVLFANGTEEIEALTQVDVLRRTGSECDIVSVSGEYPRGAHGIVVKADKLCAEVDFDAYDAIVIPGGMPGASNIAADKKAVAGIAKAIAEGRTVAAICAAPAVVLAAHGLIKGKTVTCYPAQAFIDMMKDSHYTGRDVEVCDNVITGNGPKAAMAFALAICEHMGLVAGF